MRSRLAIGTTYSLCPNRLGGCYTFGPYIIGSPTVWWDESAIINYEKDFAANNTRLSAKVFMSVGFCESDRMVAGFQKMAGIMQDRQYQNLELITHMFEDDNHVSVTGKRW